VDFDVVDLILILLVLAAMVYGWRTGVLRQIVAISAAMFAFIAASQLYQPLAAWFSAIAQIATPNYFQGLAYLLIFLFAAAVWFLAIYRLYPYSRLVDAEGGGLAILDNLLGLLFGALLGSLLALALVGIVELLVYYAWPPIVPSGPRDAIHAEVSESRIVRWVSRERMELADYLDEWVPGIRVAREGRILP
jgi:uncharacterized membrane protein required for colicin V production